MKRNMSRVTSIVALAFSVLGILGGLTMVIGAYWFSYVRWTDWDMLGSFYHYWRWSAAVFALLVVFGLIMIAMSIAILAVSTRLLRQVNDPSANPADFNGKLVAITVLSFFGGSWITMVLGIVALSMNNEDNGVVTTNNPKSARPTGNEFDAAVSRLKMYKADGIIDEAMFKQKMEELFAKHYMQD